MIHARRPTSLWRRRCTTQVPIIFDAATVLSHSHRPFCTHFHRRCSTVYRFSVRPNVGETVQLHVRPRAFFPIGRKILHTGKMVWLPVESPKLPKPPEYRGSSVIACRKSVPPPMTPSPACYSKGYRDPSRVRARVTCQHCTQPCERP